MSQETVAPKATDDVATPTRDACGNYVHAITCSRCKRGCTLTTNVEKVREGWVCFLCWKEERGLP